MEEQYKEVAPLAGAWIEIGIEEALSLDRLVAPLAGAWIEMVNYLFNYIFNQRRSPRGSVN